MTVDNALRIFMQFLNHSWCTVSPLLNNRQYTTDTDSVNDWLQANWEVLVERRVLDFNNYLEVYGDGADFHGASSRIINPDALPNFRVVLKPKVGSRVHDILNDEPVILQDTTFEKFVGFRNGFYNLEPDFHFVLITDNILDVERVVAVEDIKFELERL